MTKTVLVKLTGNSWPGFNLEVGSIHECVEFESEGWNFKDQTLQQKCGLIYRDDPYWSGVEVSPLAETETKIETEHPSHYNAVEGMPEVWDILDAFFPNDPLMWQAGKYLFRAGRKDGVPIEKDLEKLEQYSARRRAQEKS